jgi:hypothetical protein
MFKKYKIKCHVYISAYYVLPKLFRKYLIFCAARVNKRLNFGAKIRHFSRHLLIFTQCTKMSIFNEILCAHIE